MSKTYSHDGLEPLGYGSVSTSMATANELYSDGHGEAHNKSVRCRGTGRRSAEGIEQPHHVMPKLPGGLAAYWLPQIDTVGEYVDKSGLSRDDLRVAA